ncbi:hypothetical protein Tco_0189499 [Tanacetum coccineum]|uniref:Uncharacterized protein n=1 Tax=Tanacetum coccineum TaxID=301880 RepID=A0ABQ5GWH7_9ASTR
MRMTTGESIALEIQFDLMVELLPGVKGVRYQVRVREFATWVHDFASLDKLSPQHDLKSEAFGNDQDILSLTSTQRKKGDHDKKEQMGYDMERSWLIRWTLLKKAEIIGERMMGKVSRIVWEEIGVMLKKDMKIVTTMLLRMWGW